MKNSVIILMMFLSMAAIAQDKKAIQSALKTFDDAKDVKGMINAVQEMKKVSDSDQKDWYSAYWSSFFYTQIGRLTDTPSLYYDSAQTYFDRANDVAINRTDEQSSNFHTLQSLIHGLKAGEYWRVGDRANGQRLDGLASQSLNLALQTNANNPRIYLLSGTDLVGNGLRTRDVGSILGGKALLERAKELYASEESGISIEPNWGSGWVNFWMARAKLN